MTLAEQLAPHLAGTLTHPGDDHTEPFPLAPLPIFQHQAMLPKGMAEDMAKQAGLPSPDFAKLWLEAIIALIEDNGVTIIDNADLADLQAAAAAHEHRRNQTLTFHTPCGHTLRAMVKGFDTQNPTVPCELVNHECRTR